MQATEILTRIDALLASAGIDKTRVLTANIWLSDAAHFDAFNAVWDAWVPAGHAPTRACAGVADETRSRRRDRRDRARLTPAPPARGIPDDIRHARPGRRHDRRPLPFTCNSAAVGRARRPQGARHETSLGNAGLIQREGVSVCVSARLRHAAEIRVQPLARRPLSRRRASKLIPFLYRYWRIPIRRVMRRSCAVCAVD